MPDTADFIDAPVAAAARADEAAEALFVRGVDLPTPSVRQARAAVAQQLDILSPLPPAEVVFAVVLLGPAEAGQSRFAVGFAPRALVERRAAPGARTVILPGRLEGELIPFRFDVAGAAPARADWRAILEAATLAGVCFAIVLGALSLRLDREIDRAQARADAVTERSQRLSREAAAVTRVASAWRAAQATRKASVLGCALAGLARANGGPVSITALSLEGGQVTARLAAPPSEASAVALKALGFQVGPAPSPMPSAPSAVSADVRLGSAACR